MHSLIVPAALGELSSRLRCPIKEFGKAPCTCQLRPTHFIHFPRTHRLHSLDYATHKDLALALIVLNFVCSISTMITRGRFAPSLLLPS
eukprot:5232790-Amphidinium_carterae.1